MLLTADMSSRMTVVVPQQGSQRDRQKVYHWPLRSVARRGPASRISTHGRGEFGMMKGRQESTPRRVSLYTQLLLRERTVMSSGFPPTMKMKMQSHILKLKKKI